MTNQIAPAHSISENGLKLIENFEGLRLKPYLDVVGVPTIGYGTTHYENGKAVTLKEQPITQARAEQLLNFEAQTKGYVLSQSLQKNNISVNQNQFDSLVSFAYNVGIEGLFGSTLYKKLNINPADPSIKTEFAKWNKGHANGQVITIDALTKRRAKEAALYFSVS